MEKKFNQKAADQVKKSSIRVRGACSKAILEYLEKIGQKEKIPQIEEKLSQNGYPIKLNKIEAAAWYPVAMEAALILIIKETLGWQDEEIKELGRSVPKTSFIVRILTKFFISAEKFYQQAPVVWRKHFDGGKLETVEFNEKEKYHILRIKSFDFSPVYCLFLSGFFETMTSFLIKSGKIWSEETACVFRGDSYHQFKISWQ